jgi:anaerobic magnesium-protoporphyrin IX monomethyl ester cyclase
MTPRMGIMYLASALREEKHDVRIASATRLGLKGVRKLVGEWRPAVVGYTALTGEHIRLLELNRALKKEFAFTSVFGGPHATFCPDELLSDPDCDAVCIGEGDIAFPDFCRRLEQGGDWWQTPNFVLRRNGEIQRNPLLPLIEDLDSLPMPDHDLMYAADPALAKDNVKYFYSNRGCPCKCTYCFHAAYNKLYHGKGPVVRHRSAENFLDEICYVKEHYHMTHVIINDDSFLLNSKQWLDDFCAGYKARVALPFICSFRANVVTEPVIAQLCEAGMTAAAMGVECGNEVVFNDLLKRNMTKDQIRRAAAIIKNNGVKLMTLSLCGLPISNPYEIDLQTLELNAEIMPDWARASLLYPYPATEIRDFALQAGFLPESHVPLFESNKRSSAFTFASPMEKRRVENLHKLFGILVRHPRLRKHADFLCSLPLGSLYRLILYVHYGYGMRFVILPFSSPLREIWSYFPVLLTLFRKK